MYWYVCMCISFAQNLIGFFLLYIKINYLNNGSKRTNFESKKACLENIHKCAG